MTLKNPMQEMEEALGELELLDAHTHLVGGRLAARGLQDVLLYHMVVSDLYSAGCPSGARLTQYPGWPTDEEARARIEEALYYLPHVENTSTFWVLRTILHDLHGWKEPITHENWRRLDAIIREKADDRAWVDSIFSRLNLRRAVTEIARRGAGEDDEKLQYSLEWAFFTRSAWGESDTALYELERCWGKTPESPSPIGAGARPIPERRVLTLEDVRDAMEHYVRAIPYGQVLSTATHISTDIDYRHVTDAEMEEALSRRDRAGPAERDIYASYIHEAFLTALEKEGDRIVFQFSLGAEPLPFETASRLSQRTIAQLADMIARHPKLRFQCFLSSRHSNQSLCTLARELPNLSLAGYWWHNFFPDAARQVLSERLDMLPANRQIGFFSDAYCIDWTYGKAVLVRKLFAQVLAEKVQLGQYSRREALDVARRVLLESPRCLLGMVPARGTGRRRSRGK